MIRSIQVGSGISCIIFFLGAVLFYNYRESSYGMLPVINYPFRDEAPIFLIISIFLGVLFIITTILYEVKIKDS
ncbi:MAG: hypothetical protein ACFFB2_13110 [Promethearchaeota archaeon]